MVVWCRDGECGGVHMSVLMWRGWGVEKFGTVKGCNGVVSSVYFLLVDLQPRNVVGVTETRSMMYECDSYCSGV